MLQVVNPESARSQSFQDLPRDGLVAVLVHLSHGGPSSVIVDRYWRHV